MNRFTLSLSLSLALLAAGCSSITVYSDYAGDVDFSRFRTFSWSPTEATSVVDTAPLVHSRIVDSIQEGLETRGLSKDASDPDLLVTYHTEEHEELRLETTHLGYGDDWHWDPYWTWGASAATSSRVHTYIRGTLIIDIWESSTNRLVWRGSAEGIVPEDPQRGEVQIRRAIDRMLREWEQLSAAP